jgi:hypothetical protein
MSKNVTNFRQILDKKSPHRDSSKCGHLNLIESIGLIISVTVITTVEGCNSLTSFILIFRIVGFLLAQSYPNLCKS